MADGPQRTTRLARPLGGRSRSMRAASLALALALGSASVLGACSSDDDAGSSGGTNGTGGGTSASSVEMTAAMTGEQVSVAFLRAVVAEEDTSGFVRDETMVAEAKAAMRTASTDVEVIGLDPEVSQQLSGRPDECAVNDVTLSCYVLVEQVVQDGGTERTTIAVGVAVYDMEGVTSPDDVGEQVPPYVISVLPYTP